MSAPAVTTETQSKARPWASLRAKGLGLLVVPTVGLLAVTAALALVERRERETEEVVAHATSMRIGVQRVLTLLVDAETGVRGYVATGDERFLQPYERSQRELPGAFAELERLHRHPADDLVELRALAGQVLVELDELQRVGDDPLGRLGAARRGKITMDRIRARIATITAEHEAVQLREQNASDRLEDIVVIAAFGAVALGLLGGIGSNGLFFNRVVARLRRVQASAHHLAHGGTLPDGDAVHGNDELADLSASLREAAAIIESERARLALALDIGRITVFEIDDELRIRDQRGSPLAGDGSLEAALALIHPSDHVRVLEALETVRKGGPTQDFKLQILDDGGWMAGRIARLVLAEGKESILGVSMDISEVRRTEEALRERERELAAEKLRHSEERGRHNALLLASAGEGIFSIDAAGLCTSINPAGARMLGYEVADLAGADMHAAIHHSKPDGTPLPKTECPVFRCMSTLQGERGEAVYWRRDGRRLPVEYSSFPLVDDGVVHGAVITFSDATDRGQAQAELEASGAELRRAIAGGELRLYYQPKVDLTTGGCEAVEALVRWQRDDRLVFPDEFIPVAEATGSIYELTCWVVDEAARQAAAWRGAGLDLRIAVNLSAASLKDETLIERIATSTAAAGLPASCIEVEVTETTLVEDTDCVLINLAHFKAMGVRSAIDDFGTGFSSLSYLKHLPVNYIKIDKSFVMNMPRDTRDQAIVSASIQLAHSLGIRVVAEGVEDELVARLLRIAGCDIGQGYHWTKPVPVGELECWLRERATTAG